MVERTKKFAHIKITVNASGRNEHSELCRHIDRRGTGSVTLHRQGSGFLFHFDVFTSSVYVRAFKQTFHSSSTYMIDTHSRRDRYSTQYKHAAEASIVHFRGGSRKYLGWQQEATWHDASLAPTGFRSFLFRRHLHVHYVGCVNLPSQVFSTISMLSSHLRFSRGMCFVGGGGCVQAEENRVFVGVRAEGSDRKRFFGPPHVRVPGDGAPRP